MLSCGAVGSVRTHATTIVLNIYCVIQRVAGIRRFVHLRTYFIALQPSCRSRYRCPLTGFAVRQTGGHR